MAEKTAGATATPGAEPAERLDALPYTTLCLADARRRARPR
jgi:hypothetical protein